MGLFNRNIDEDEKKFNKMKEKNEGIKDNKLVTSKPQSKFKKAMARIAIALFGSVIIGAGASSIGRNNEPKTADASDKDKIERESTDESTEKTLEKDIRETLKESTNIDVSIEETTSQKVEKNYIDYSQKNSVEDLGENIDEIVSKAREEVGLRENETVPDNSVIENKTMEEQQTNIIDVTPTRDQSEIETTKKTFPSKGGNNISITTDKDANIKEEDGTIKIEGEDGKIKFEPETQPQSEEIDSEVIVPANPFDDEVFVNEETKNKKTLEEQESITINDDDEIER